MPRGLLEEAHLISPPFLIATLTILLAAANAGPGSACGASPGNPPAGQIEDRGFFVISVAGQRIGTEAFDIRSAGDRFEAEAKIELRVEREGKVHEFRTAPKLVLDSALQPVTYTWDQKSPQPSHLEVDFRPSPAKARYKTVAGEEDRRDFQLPKDVVVLDGNVFHHYQLVVYRYRGTSGGKQTFQAFVPQEALPGLWPSRKQAQSRSRSMGVHKPCGTWFYRQNWLASTCGWMTSSTSSGFLSPRRSLRQCARNSWHIHARSVQPLAPAAHRFLQVKCSTTPP